MRVLKDGRIKIKFDELRVGMVLKWDDHSFYRKDGKQFLMVINIIYVSNSKWFVALRGRSENCFNIPDVHISPKYSKNADYKHEYLTWHNLKNMHLIPQEILIGEAIQVGGKGEKEKYEKLKAKLKYKIEAIKEERCAGTIGS